MKNASVLKNCLRKFGYFCRNRLAVWPLAVLLGPSDDTKYRRISLYARDRDQNVMNLHKKTKYTYKLGNGFL